MINAKNSSHKCHALRTGLFIIVGTAAALLLRPTELAITLNHLGAYRASFHITQYEIISLNLFFNNEFTREKVPYLDRIERQIGNLHTLYNTGGINKDEYSDEHAKFLELVLQIKTIDNLSKAKFIYWQAGLEMCRGSKINAKRYFYMASKLDPGPTVQILKPISECR